MTNEEWVQTPGSGSGKIKGDLQVPLKHNIFCVEVKFYKDVVLTSKIYTQKSNNFISGGVNCVNKHRICNKNRYSYLKRIMVSFLLQQYANQKIHCDICTYCLARCIYSYRRTLARKRGDSIYKWR